MDAPTFTFAGGLPSPGSDLSLHAGGLGVRVVVSGEPLEPVTFDWVYQIQRTRGTPCIRTSGTATAGPERPLILELTGPIHEDGFCGSNFVSNYMQLTIVVEGQVVYDVNEALEYHVVP